MHHGPLLNYPNSKLVLEKVHADLQLFNIATQSIPNNHYYQISIKSGYDLHILTLQNYVFFHNLDQLQNVRNKLILKITL